MIKQSANKNFICPKCGGYKTRAAAFCFNCNQFGRRLTYAKPGERLEALIVALAKGQTVKEVAGEWKRSPKTVEYFWAVIKAKFGFRCYQDATRYAIKRGLIGLS